MEHFLPDPPDLRHGTPTHVPPDFESGHAITPVSGVECGTLSVQSTLASPL